MPEFFREIAAPKPLAHWLEMVYTTWQAKPLVEAVFTVRAMFVEAVSEPDVPVTVTVEVPTVAALLAVKVITLLPVVGFTE